MLNTDTARYPRWRQYEGPAPVLEKRNQAYALSTLASDSGRYVMRARFCTQTYGVLDFLLVSRLAAIFCSSQLYWKPPATRVRYSRFSFAAPQPTLYGAVSDNIKDKVRTICGERVWLPLGVTLCALQNGLYHELYARALRGAGQMLADVQHLHRAPGTLLPAAVFWSPP